MVWSLPSHQKAVRDNWWSKTWWQRSSIWCSTGIGPWNDPVLVVHLPFGQYCKTSWTRVSPIRRRNPNFAFRSITAEPQSSLARIEACVSHVDSWLVRNKLKLNWGKPSYLFWMPAIAHARLLRPSKYRVNEYCLWVLLGTSESSSIKN